MTNKEYTKPDNDRLTDAFGDLVPEEYRGTDRFLDCVTWNVRYFHDKDETRVEKISRILNAINADIFVLEEILENSLDSVISKLKELGGGHYTAAYGTTGGQQRIALVWDVDWVRAKDDARELFGKREVLAPNGKDIFPRLPLLGEFVCLSHVADPFDFQMVGLHLKSQRGGGELQRQLAAQKLANWLETEAPKVDADVILTGDWNQTPDAAAWEPFRQMEKHGQAYFTNLNQKNEISHLMYKNKNEFGTRLDLTAVTVSASKELAETKSSVIRWKSLDELLATSPDSKKLKAYIKEVSDNISDHMPVVTRFYFTEKS
jgi:endonuclease/exonuclease/phosphatase family metal-dependent hydrolase